MRIDWTTILNGGSQSHAPESQVGPFSEQVSLGGTAEMRSVIGLVFMRTSAACFLLLLLVGCSTAPPGASTAHNQNETVPDSRAILGDWVIIEAMRADFEINVNSRRLVKRADSSEGIRQVYRQLALIFKQSCAAGYVLDNLSVVDQSRPRIA